MSADRDEGPVYYREIQKNAYLKRIPNETTTKLLPLGHKKPPLKAMWTVLCVHNGRTPYLEQYPQPQSPATLAHRPQWRACLRSARHVTCSVSPQNGSEYDFLIDTEQGPVRMLAPDWESMQDWVSTLRNKLHELRIMGRGENVYCGGPPPDPAAPRAPLAPARDPTSPLPAVPPVPPDRVPGIELTTPVTRPQIQSNTSAQPTQTPATSKNPPEPTQNPSEPTEEIQPTQERENIDISNWEPDSIPSTSQANEPKKSVAKICGQNICLDDSILKRNLERATTDSDEEFFAEIDRISDSVDNLCVENSDSDVQCDHTQRVLVNNQKDATVTENGHSDRPTNITVIQVSNKPPHTAIPVLGPETNVFNFDFKQNVNISDSNERAVKITENNDSIINIKDKNERDKNEPTSTNKNESIVNITNNDRFVNIVNTEMNENSYGTVFTKESDYGHISLTTTVSLTGDVKTDNDGIYERLCLASTSSDKSPVPSKKMDKIRNIDKIRKSSLPNLDTESAYECLFPNNNNNKNTVTVTQPTSLVLPRENHLVTSRVTTNTRLNNSDERVNSDNRVHVVTSTVAVTDNTRLLRAAVERSHSQNAYDRTTTRENIRQNSSPKRDVKIDKEKSENAPKPIWKRGLTELSLLSKLRSLGQGKRQDSPSRKHADCSDRAVTSPAPAAAAARRSRPEGRPDTARRRSSSLTNGQVPGPVVQSQPSPALVPLRARQAAWLRGEQTRGAATHHAVSTTRPPLFADYNSHVWIASWNGSGAAVDGRAGDRVVCVRGMQPRDAAHARQLVRSAHAHTVNILFHRVPLAKIYVITKRDLEPIGLRLDSECAVLGAEPGSPSSRAGLPPPGKWIVTEANNRPLAPDKGASEELSRVSLHGTEVWVLLQPAPLVGALRARLGRKIKTYQTALAYPTYDNWAEPDAVNFDSPWSTVSRAHSLDRLVALRQVMAAYGVDAYIVPTADAHNSQYISPAHARREWLSGLSGSSGTALVTAGSALLWTDARYWTQFYLQVNTTYWELMRQGTDVSIQQWLVRTLPPNSTVAVDPTTYTRAQWSPLESALRAVDVTLSAVAPNLVDLARTNLGDPAPPQPNNPLITHTLEFSGKRSMEKISELVAQMSARGASALVLTALDDIAYTLNLRGTDIPYNPVFFSYLIIQGHSDSLHNVILFWGSGSFSPEVATHLISEGVTLQVRPYGDIFDYLSEMSRSLPDGSTIWLTDDGSHAIFAAAEAGENTKILSTLSPVALIKCVKNEVELAGFRNAHIKDGTAVVRFLRWVHQQVGAGANVTEIDVVDKLHELRAEEAHFMGPSFSTIAGAGPNGAVIHYHPDRDQPHTVILRDHMLLVDSGGQYRDGTTDITRTRHMSSSPSPAQRSAFTRALKGQINMATAVFPKGIVGHTLETLARKALWDVGLDYAHGTGHGVGHFLNVHEGPSWILSGPSPTDPGIVPGMIFSNEPGYYEVGEYGIRHEDLAEVIALTRDSDHILADGLVGDFGGVGALGFHTISLAPHQTACLDVDLLTDTELQYLNSYHARVLSTLGPVLQSRNLTEDFHWLERECAPLQRNSAAIYVTAPVLVVISVFLSNF